jgi:hypothetical protein
MTLDTTSLGSAVRRVREGLARCQREPADEQVRDGRHTYDSKVASQVVSAIPVFVEEAEYLYAELRRRLV